MDIIPIPVLADNFAYALVPPRGRECALVDPGEAGPVRAFLAERNLRPTTILLTHHHPDHVGGAAELGAEYGAEIWCSAIDHPRLPFANRTFRDDDQAKLFGGDVLVVHAPGHTAGQICYWLPDEAAVFTGDTLFSGGCGRLFEGSAAEMHSSLRRLARLPGHTRVYFGHEYTVNNLKFILAHAELATDRAALVRVVEPYLKTCEAELSAGRPTTPTDISIELRVNPFLAAATEDEFARWREARNHW